MTFPVCQTGSCVLGGIPVQPTKDGRCLVCKQPFANPAEPAERGYCHGCLAGNKTCDAPGCINGTGSCVAHG